MIVGGNLALEGLTCQSIELLICTLLNILQGYILESSPVVKYGK